MIQLTVKEKMNFFNLHTQPFTTKLTLNDVEQLKNEVK
jgi:hypothetical protein